MAYTDRTKTAAYPGIAGISPRLLTRASCRISFRTGYTAKIRQTLSGCSSSRTSCRPPRDRHRHLERHCTGISTGSASNRTASPAVPHRHHCLCPGRQGQRRLCDTGRSTGDPQCVSCRSAGTEQRRLRHCHQKCGAAVPGADAFAAQRHSRRRHLEPPACGTAPIKKDSFSCLTL